MGYFGGVDSVAGPFRLLSGHGNVVTNRARDRDKDSDPAIRGVNVEAYGLSDAREGDGQPGALATSVREEHEDDRRVS
jgi:hypothetical protein